MIHPHKHTLSEHKIARVGNLAVDRDNPIATIPSLEIANFADVTYFFAVVGNGIGIILVFGQLDRIHFKLPLPNQQGDTARQPL
jgi:hypothetical protein